MAITGYLSEFSLPEIFQFLEQGQKTGRLTLRPLSSNTSQKTYYIWLRQGRIIAASNRLDNQGLLSLIVQRGWIKAQAAAKLSESHLQGNPLGLFLKSHNLIEAEQLKLLFYVQVMQQICALFAIADAQFEFDSHGILPMIETTGLSSPGAEVSLAGLRALKDWSALKYKLPDPTSSLTSIVKNKPHLHLNQLEWQVWEFTDDHYSLKAVAEQLRLPIEKVQQIAFRLMVVNLVEELPMITANFASEPDVMENESMGTNANGLSQEFLQNLMGFLQAKAS
ncbi:DUF4388 domain-containing protein [Crocosphaera sp. XPORK-15E]|uniref:DUF4388 domain-containing protein n=1 Tax=Crocosphaera sp. XPORK-15E TaxID=3110247 RepID=UPI002B1F64E2|nr:DUF4388 domain-containing protein [Crocosphaera sp. XPORK-15E]MEA5532824.1 DUF4388 domain-containing protein [Crocosphaera sp. XPORK-15E]